MVQFHSDFFIVQFLYGKGHCNQRTHTQFSGIDHVNAQILQQRFGFHSIPIPDAVHVNLFLKGKLSLHAVRAAILGHIENSKLQLPLYIHMVFRGFDFVNDHASPLQDKTFHIRFLIRYVSVVLQRNLRCCPAFYTIHMYIFLY